MIILKSLEDIKKQAFKNCRLTVGRFQGVHLGHKHLIDQLGPKNLESPKVVITFDPPPEEVLGNKRYPQMMTLTQKIEALRELGIDVIFFIPFDLKIAKLPAVEFARHYIFAGFSPKLVAVGYDFAFGNNREGTIETLREMVTNNVQLIQVEALKIENEIVSTSLIRKKILEGDVNFAHVLLGRPFEIEGPVIHGEKRGRMLGFPTINLDYGEYVVLPKRGVYAVKVEVDKNLFLGVCNVGVNPTFTQENRMKVECHVLDFDRDVYKKSVRISFFERLRYEVQFLNKQDLISQIQKDIAMTRALFSSLSNG